MKNPLKLFTGGSLLTALGLTLVSYLVLPVIKEMLNPSVSRHQSVLQWDEEKERAFKPHR